jgi:hypothetical protein
MAKKKVSIDYTARDFNSIKRSLVDYAQRYYPQVYQDFNDASFGSLMIDTVSYVGDIMSYFIDYQVNESFLDTAFETSNIIKLSRQLGYKYQNVASSLGEISLYALIPTNELGVGPDSNYYLIIKQGSTFSTTNGNSFTTVEDIRFDNPANEIVVGRVDGTTGLPTSYAVKAKGAVISGEIKQGLYTVGDYIRFRKIDLDDTDVVEIMSVEDSDGNEYFQVDNLTQNTIYKSFSNLGQNTDTVKEYLRPVIVPRRFTFDYDGDNYFLQFGYGSEDEIKINPIADPSSVAIQLYGRDYVSDVNLDPSKLLTSDKLGVSPSNTTLTITYRKNSNANSNAKTGTVRNITNIISAFDDITTLNSSKILSVRRSLECTNENPIVGSSVSPSGEEIKQRALSHFATQKRAVTSNDYESMVYSMPAQYGAIARCNVILDQDSFKRNLNLYVLSSDQNGKLISSNDTQKENLRFWISDYKMINDTVDIINGKIVNIEINFEIIGDPDYNASDVYAKCINILAERYNRALQMGEPFYLTDIYYELNRVRGVVDTQNVFLVNKNGTRYSDLSFSIEENMSADGRYLSCPSNVCFEIKFPTVDIRGVVR